MQISQESLDSILELTFFSVFQLNFLFSITCYTLYIIQLGDIELNPGPKSSLLPCLYLCHWNRNSLAVHNFSKVNLLEAHNSIHSSNVICLSEAFLYSTIHLNHPDLLIIEYMLLHDDHPNNVKRARVYMYYKSCPPLSVLNISRLNGHLILDLLENET